MNILVLIKFVPSMSSGISEDDKQTAELIINPADLAALEEALKLKDSLGASVSVMTMGALRCESLLRDTLSRGADEAVLISDRLFAGADTSATSRVLARAVERLGGYELILCGRRSTDGETGQVGVELAARLGLPCAVNCAELSVEDSSVSCMSLNETGSERLRLSLPALISFRNGVNSPRLPSLMGKRTAKNKRLVCLTADELGFQAHEVGQAGSPTIVTKSVKKPFEKRRAIRLDASCAQEALTQIRSIKDECGK